MHTRVSGCHKVAQPTHLPSCIQHRLYLRHNRRRKYLSMSIVMLDFQYKLLLSPSELHLNGLPPPAIIIIKMSISLYRRSGTHAIASLPEQHRHRVELMHSSFRRHSMDTSSIFTSISTQPLDCIPFNGNKRMHKHEIVDFPSPSPSMCIQRLTQAVTWTTMERRSTKYMADD